MNLSTHTNYVRVALVMPNLNPGANEETINLREVPMIKRKRRLRKGWKEKTLMMGWIGD